MLLVLNHLSSIIIDKCKIHRYFVKRSVKFHKLTLESLTTV